MLDTVRPILFIALLGMLASCEATDDGRNVAVPQNESSEGTPPGPVVPSEMGAISLADIEAELAPGASCSLVYDGKNLLVAVAEDAIAKPNGTTLHFERLENPGSLRDGGAFTSSGITIAIAPAEAGGQQIEELFVKPAAVTVTHEDGRQTAFEAEWQCGS